MELKTLIAGAALAASLAVPAVAKEFKFASFTPPGHTITRSVIDVLNDKITKASNGEMTIKPYFGGELGASPVEQYVLVVQDVADMAWSLPGYTSSQFKKTMIAELPGAVPEGKCGCDAMWDAYDQIQGEFPGVKPLALWTSEPNVMIMKSKVIRKPEDLKGLKIRVAGATAADVASALGATPVQMPISQVYNALQTGLIDGVFTGASTLNDFKLDEVANSFTFGAPLGRLSFFTVMNKGVYDGLSDADKKIIDDASGRSLSKSAEDAWNATADAGVERAKKDTKNTFVFLTPEEAKPFADAVSAVTADYVKSVGGEQTLAEMQK